MDASFPKRQRSREVPWSVSSRPTRACWRTFAVLDRRKPNKSETWSPDGAGPAPDAPSSPSDARSRESRTPRTETLALQETTIYIDRVAKKRPSIPQRAALREGRKSILVVLFVPSVERDGTTAVNQHHWVDAALDMFGRVFGGATAYPKAKGIWRDDERGGVLVKDEPVVIHCYTTPGDIQNPRKLAELASFCRMMGRDARQGEIGLVIGDEYLAIRDFAGE